MKSKKNGGNVLAAHDEPVFYVRNKTAAVCSGFLMQRYETHG
ncbi:MAG: hypothetical protein Q8865_03130 [Bacillota bacterium]|nr:hypothetical protein [Bacillota bacterium]